jgi:hypothetical protein
MKSALVTMLRWTSKKLAVAAEKVNESAVLADDAVKTTYVKMRSWVLRQRAALAAWFDDVATKLEASGGVWDWFKHRAEAMACGLASIFLGVLAILYVVSIPFSSFFGMFICLFMAALLACMSVAASQDAVKLWKRAEAIEFIEAGYGFIGFDVADVTEKKPVAPVQMTRKQQRKAADAAARAQRFVTVPV